MKEYFSIFSDLCVSVCIGLCDSVCVCMHACFCVCMCLFVCICLCLSVCVHTLNCVSASVRSYSHVCVCSASVYSHSNVCESASVFSHSHVCVCVCRHLCMTCVLGCPWRTEKGIGLSRVRITSVCKLPDMNTRIELRSPERAMHVLNHRAFYLILFEKGLFLIVFYF